jgi:hypothetical protein
MLNNTSHYKYLATHVDDILTWSKDPMDIIKAQEKTNLLMNIGIPQNYNNLNQSKSTNGKW